MYIKNSNGWEHITPEKFITTIAGNNWEAKFDFVSYFSRMLNSAAQESFYSQERRVILHPGDILHLYKHAGMENDFYFTIGSCIQWSRNLEDLNLDINYNMQRGIVHVVHFQRRGRGSKTIITFKELPIEEYSKYGKENNE